MDQSSPLFSLSPQTILDSLNDGVYVTDLERRIVFWNRAARQITGWESEAMLGRTCFDDKLCHEDKDGHRLCGKDLCPLHRSIVTGTASTVPIIIFARTPEGRKIPMQVSVAPIRNEEGRIIGGVETFRDLSHIIGDMERARSIQAAAMALHFPADERLAFAAHYQPNDIIGGDFYIVDRIDEDGYAFMLADVMGHGVASALYTMQLRALWNEHRGILPGLPEFVRMMNHQLHALTQSQNAFAAAMFGYYDAATRVLELVSAGSPPLLLFHADGTDESVVCTGLPLGMLSESNSGSTSLALRPGDTLLFYTDGASEIFSAGEDSVALGDEGLLELLRRMGYPSKPVPFSGIIEALLNFSGGIRFDDDLTFFELRVR